MQLSRHRRDFDHDRRQGSPKRRTQGIQLYFLIITSALLAYELYIQIFLSRRSQTNPFHVASPQNSDDQQPFTIEIFAAPKPFIGTDNDVNLRAIRSWQALNPKPHITLLGNEVGYETVATEYGLNLHSDIDKTFLGVPLFNSMLNVANRSSADVSVIINGDIILLQDFVNSIRTTRQRFKDFLVISARYDLQELPSDIAEGDDDFYSKLRAYTLKKGAMHTYGGMDLWAWNPAGPRLFDPVMPHFIFGRGKYDNWLTHETIVANRRAVIDASEAVLSIHIRHGYNRVSQRGNDPLSPTSRKLLAAQKQGMFWSENKKSKFELFINIFLSFSIGTYQNQYGSILFAPWRLARCLEPGGTCLVQRVRPGVCNCEYASASVATQTDEVLVKGSRVIRCGAVSHEERENYAIPVSVNLEDRAPTFGMPLTQMSVAERVAIDNTIIITALNYGYKDMMMNWICNMRRLGITNFIIAALDADLYRYAFVRGLPVYYDNTVLSGHSLSLKDTTYGSPEFKELTKMKSRVVLQFLKLGYDALWTDTDIVWFKNPIEDLRAQMADLTIQSNAPDDEAANGKRRINSGFYLALSNERLIEVFEDVILFASRSKMSEQPCFYDVICGKHGERRIGNDSCTFKNTVTKLLDRTLYPNGITQGVWDVEAATIPTAFPHIFIVHNNWVKGSQGKWDRFHRHGFIFHDEKSGLCRYGPTA